MAGRAGSAPLAVGAAVGIAMCCAFPFFLPAPVFGSALLAYWARWGTVALVATAIVTFTPALRAWPRRAAALLLRPSPRAFGAIVAAAATVLALVFVVRAFDSGVSTSDEVALLWHAKMIAHGRLSLPPDPNPEFFGMDNVIDVGRWYSQYPIGGPLVLALGVATGMPFLVNPVCAGLGAACFAHFARVAFGELEGRVTAVLFAFSPGVLLIAGTYLNHVPVLMLGTAILAMLAEWDRAPSRRAGTLWAAGIGLALGLAATIRPLDGLVLAAVAGAFQLHRVVRQPGRGWELVAQAAAGAVALAPLLYANAVTNGGPFRFGYEVLWGPAHRLGFHADPQGGEHTLGRGAVYASTYVTELNASLELWPLPALAFAFVGLAATRRATRWDALLIGFIAAQVAAYSAYWWRGEFLGPRFLYTALPAVVAIIARAPFRVAEYEGAKAGRALASLMAACMLVAWTSSAGAGVWGTARAMRGLRRSLRVDVGTITRMAGVHHAVVFLREALPARILRRLWGVGVTRSAAVSLLATRDACSLQAALARAEADTVMPRGEAKAAFVDSAAAFLPDDATLGTAPVPQARVASRDSMTPECIAAGDVAGFVPASFGAALPLEPIGPDGRIAGDVIYAMDLGSHDDALRARFGDRAWYRLALAIQPDGTLTGTLVPF